MYSITNQDPGQSNQESGWSRVPRDELGPHKTNHGWGNRPGPAGRTRVCRTNQGPSGRVRALRDASGSSGTCQGPSRWMWWQSKRRGHSGHDHWPPSKINQRGPTYLVSPPPPIAKGGRLLGPQAKGALMRPAAGFGTRRDGSGLVGQSRVPQPAGLTRVPRDGSEPCRMNQGPRGTYLGSAL